jgi:hypothetical protein
MSFNNSLKECSIQFNQWLSIYHSPSSTQDLGQHLYMKAFLLLGSLKELSWIIDMWWQRSYEWRGLWVQVCERLGPSLYDFLRKNNYRPFPVDLVRDFGRQLLESVACRCHIYTNCLSSSCSLQFSDPSQAVCLYVEDNSCLAWYFGFFWILVNFLVPFTVSMDGSNS